MPQVRKSRALLPAAAALVVALAVGSVAGGSIAPHARTGQPAESLAADYHMLERDLVRLTAAGEGLIGRGDACLATLRQDSPQALGLCHGFLGDAVAWMQPLGGATDRLRQLDASVGDRTLIAIGAGRDEALAAVAGLSGVLTRLTLQIAEADVALSLTPPAFPQVAAEPI